MFEGSEREVLAADQLLDCLSESERRRLRSRLENERVDVSTAAGTASASAASDPSCIESYLSDRQARAITQFIIETESQLGRSPIDIANRLLGDVAYSNKIDQRTPLLDNLAGLVSQYEDFLEEAQRDYYGEEECAKVRKETLAMIESDLLKLSKAFSEVQETDR